MVLTKPPLEQNHMKDSANNIFCNFCKTNHHYPDACYARHPRCTRPLVISTKKPAFLYHSLSPFFCECTWLLCVLFTVSNHCSAFFWRSVLLGRDSSCARCGSCTYPCNRAYYGGTFKRNQVHAWSWGSTAFPAFFCIFCVSRHLWCAHCHLHYIGKYVVNPMMHERIPW